MLFNIIIILARYLFSAKTNKQAVNIEPRPWDWKMMSTVFNERERFGDNDCGKVEGCLWLTASESVVCGWLTPLEPGTVCVGEGKLSPLSSQEAESHTLGRDTFSQGTFSVT